MSRNGFYAAAQSPGEQGGIYHCNFSENAGAEVLDFAAQPYANFLLYALDGARLYAGSALPDRSGVIGTYRFGTDGALLPEAKLATPIGCCHLLQVGDFLYGANYFDGSFSEYRLEKSVPAGETKRICHHGSGPVAGRQESAHVHSCNLTPDGKFLAVIDLGCDTISSYAITPQGVAETPAEVCHVPAGDGPRHMIFSADGKLAFVLNELASSVSSFRYEEGRFTWLYAASALPPFFQGATKASAIRFDPRGRFITATNRGCDSVAAFTADEAGVLRRTALTLIDGKSPRDGNFITPDCYAAACENSDEILFFDYHEGVLTPNSARLKMPHSVYVLPENKR